MKYSNFRALSPLAFPAIKEKRLIFTPNHTRYLEFMTKVTNNLNLDGVIGAATNEELEKMMVDRGLIAGVEFHDTSVRINAFFYAHVYYFTEKKISAIMKIDQI